jgi:hypothetical protein
VLGLEYDWALGVLIWIGLNGKGNAKRANGPRLNRGIPLLQFRFRTNEHEVQFSSKEIDDLAATKSTIASPSRLASGNRDYGCLGLLHELPLPYEDDV